MYLNYKKYGEGRPLIILHGLFGSLDNWHTLSKLFGNFFTVYAIDQRNHGHSPHSNEFNYEVMVEDLSEFMEQQNLASINLLGHSMGGKTAMFFALKYPEKVENLIVADIAPKTYIPQHKEVFEALFSLNLNEIADRKDADAKLAEKIKEFSVRQFLLKNLTRGESGAYKWKMDINVIYKNYDQVNRGMDLTKRFDNPTLFIRGGKSKYIEDKDFGLIRMLFPNAEIETIENSGHWVHAEAPEEFSKLVLEFLKRNSK